MTKPIKSSSVTCGILLLLSVAQPSLLLGQTFTASRYPVSGDSANPGMASQSTGIQEVGFVDGFIAQSDYLGQTAFDSNCLSGLEGGPYKCLNGVDEFTPRGANGEPGWKDAGLIPWEAFAYGEYIGPHRTPHVPLYRVRVNDQVEFIFQLTREQTMTPYRLMVGDAIEVTSTADADLNHPEVKILSDGTVSLRLIGRVMAAGRTLDELQLDLNERYKKFFSVDPSIVVGGTITETRQQDLLNTVDARFGAGGQSRLATVTPDGTVQLPLIGSVPAIGLSLDELRREVNMRYRQVVPGFEVTPVLSQRAPRFVYVLGEVRQPGRLELTGPTSVMQAVALAGGWNAGGNLRQIVVFRRDENWRLMAVRIDLAGGLHGKRPFPSDEIWIRDSDIILVPKAPIQRAADAVDLYFTRTLYGILPVQFAFDGLTNIGGN